MDLNTNKRIGKANILSFVSRYAILMLMVILVLIVAIVQKSFFTFSNFRNILNQVAVIGILSCAVTFVLLIGCINLSVGSIMSVVGIAAALLVNKSGDIPAFLVPPLIGLALGMITGLIMSLINGRLGESFMITYGMQTVLAAAALIISGGLYVQFQNFGMFTSIGKGLNPIFIFFVVAVFCQMLLVLTPFGRNMLFIGANREAAKLSGIQVQKYVIVIFSLCGLFAGVAGTVLPARVMAANPAAGTGYELDAIAACVVGGVSMSGGSGSFLNTVAGVFIIGILGNALNLLGITTYPQMIIKGFVIVLAVSLDILNKRIQKMQGQVAV